MAFWSSQTLEAKLEGLIAPAASSAIDCNSITLTVGPEVYITPSLEGHTNHSQTKQQLSENEPFAIPPGQFAFLLTDEVVTVPSDAMAFISMKATFKLKGLVNVSGFHVDPGWTGRLIFAVFNAGPSPVHLQRGLPLFLIWYADLDHQSERKKNGRGPDSIPPLMINNITGAVDSLYALDVRLREAEKRLTDEARSQSDRIHGIEKNQRGLQVTLGVVIAIALGIFLAPLRNLQIPSNSSASASTSVSQARPVAPVSEAVPTAPLNTSAPPQRPASK